MQIAECKNRGRKKIERFVAAADVVRRARVRLGGCGRVHLYLAVSAPGAADTGRSPTGPSAAPSGGDSGEGPHLRAAYSCSAAAGPPPPNSSESRRPDVAPPATGHTSALQSRRRTRPRERARPPGVYWFRYRLLMNE